MSTPQEVSEKCGISAMPTFQFYKSKVKIDELRGADPAALEKKIKQHIGSDAADDDVGVPGHVCFVVHSFIHSFIHSLIHSFIHSFIKLLIIHSFIHPFSY